MSWVGRELIIVMLAQKKKKIHTHIQFSSMKIISLHIIREDILIFRYSEEY